MAAISDTAGIFVGDVLDAFNAAEAAVLAGGDVAGAQQRLLPVLLQIVLDKQSTTGNDATTSHSARPP